MNMKDVKCIVFRYFYLFALSASLFAQEESVSNNTLCFGNELVGDSLDYSTSEADECLSMGVPGFVNPDHIEDLSDNKEQEYVVQDYEEAVAAYQNGDIDGCIQKLNELDKIALRYPGLLPDRFYWLAVALYTADRYEDAFPFLSQYIESNISEDKLYIAEAVSLALMISSDLNKNISYKKGGWIGLLGMSRYELAEAYANIVLTYPSDEFIFSARFERGLSRFYRGQYVEAKADFDSILTHAYLVDENLLKRVLLQEAEIAYSVQASSQKATKESVDLVRGLKKNHKLLFEDDMNFEDAYNSLQQRVEELVASRLWDIGLQFARRSDSGSAVFILRNYAHHIVDEYPDTEMAKLASKSLTEL